MLDKCLHIIILLNGFIIVKYKKMSYNNTNGSISPHTNIFFVTSEKSLKNVLCYRVTD